MSRILEIHEQISENAAALARLEQSIATHPGEYGLTINRRSLKKRQRELEAAFAEAARDTAVDVCRYRLFSESGEPSAFAATTAVADFQALLSLVHDAIKNGPKQRNRPSVDSLKETAFRLGYIFQGSVGFVLTLPSQQPLMHESEVDASVETVFALMQSTDQRQLAEACRAFGPAVIRLVYKWLNDHVDHKMGADIQWVRGRDVKSKVFIQQKEMQALCAIVERTSASIEDGPFDVTGVYVGIDTSDKVVHVQVPDQPDIWARWGEGFVPPELPPPIPCVASVSKETRIHLATEKEDVKYTIHRMKVGAI